MFLRIRAWLDHHERVTDAVVAGPLLAVCLALTAVVTHQPPYPDWRLYVAATLAQTLPLFWRRRVPIAAFAIVAAAALAQVPFGMLIPANAAVLIAMYMVAVRRSLTWALAAGAVVVTGDGVMTSVLEHANWHAFASNAFLTGAVWLGGRYTRSRRAQLADLRERARRAESERDARARAAAAAERARIARDLHDVVAHSVSVMVVQADGGAYALDHDPQATRRALKTISETGREALAEMRRMLGVLRASDEYGYAPRPGLADLDDLVAQVRGAGLPVELTVDGERRELPASLELVVYRVIQESLTNTLKHGGKGATARARLHYGEGTVEAAVYDDGTGSGAASDGLGHGLIGLRERVGMYGGAVTAGPRSEGGFAVVARLPVEPR